MTSSPIETYIATFPAEVQKMLQSMRKVIRDAAPQAEEAISYGIPTFKVNGKNLVHFGGFRKHIGFYPTAEGMEVFAKEFARYPHAKGSVQFPFTEGLPFDLIKKVVAHRLKKVGG